MAKFWLATFELNPDAALLSGATPVLSADMKAYAIEVLQEENELAVLLSTVDDLMSPARFHCRIGFANGSKSCNIWRDRGFPLMDAIITFDKRGLRVSSPGFLEGSALDYDAELIRITGAMLDDLSSTLAKQPLTVSYLQWQDAPDFVFPATWIRRKQASWSTKREKVSERPATQLELTVNSLRLPKLAPFEGGPATPKAIWTGSVEMPQWPPTFAYPERTSRVDLFGAPAFRFEDVEVLGFRIDLDKYGSHDDANGGMDAKLAEMVDRLNFHLETSAGERARAGLASDFRYRPATRTVMLELLRYGKMKLKEPWLTLDTDDFQSQHELLVRVLVGRVDDDTAQAHDPATFVPTLFVDNPWSKSLGRNVQGFDKRMADFCVQQGGGLTALRPDGRLPADSAHPDALTRDPEPLASITEIHISRNTGERPSGLRLLTLDCPYETCHDWDSFEEIDFDLAMSSSSFAPMRWRQSDFEDVEFRRSFASSAISGTPNSIRSIQVSPIGQTKLRQAWKDETTWITGTFRVDDGAQIARPSCMVGLTLLAEASAPEAWIKLCTILGIDQANPRTINLPGGSWYRMRCSMDLIIDNGLG